MSEKHCPLDNDKLLPVITEQGVEVDVCPVCEGVWLDRDEIYHFAESPVELRGLLTRALEKKWLSQRKSPLSNEMMSEVPMFEGDTHINYDTHSGGIWIDKLELQRFPKDKCRIDIDQNVFLEAKNQLMQGAEEPKSPSQRVQLLPLPNLTKGSMTVLAGMYAILAFVLIVAAQFTGLTAGAALLIGLVIAVLQFLFSPFIMDLMLRLVYDIDWPQRLALPDHLEYFIAETCKKKNIRFPRIGVLRDGAPQAFTYGHHPNNGRIVISEGLMELLQEDELEAVVAHEIGHMVHWDMLVMTMAQLVPLVLYYIYRALIRIRSRGRDKSAAARYAIAIGAYILYIISEYVVLWFSRLREYYADRFAGEITEKPRELANALVKIGYGLAGHRTKQKSGNEKRSDTLTGVQAMGIFNPKQAQAIAISSRTPAVKMGSDIDPDTLRDVAKWDLWNPWATYYEFHSTHPLIAKRIKMLNNQAMSMGQPAFIQFNEARPESYWDDFLLEVLIYILPAIVMIIGGFFLVLGLMGSLSEAITHSEGFVFNPGGLAVFLILLGASYLVKVLFMYPNKKFLPMNVRSLLKKVKVSAVNPVPCRIKGRIIGRGVPGLIYSEDFIFQDDTGIMYLDYQQPFAIFNFLFGLLRAKNYRDENVEIIGWYRRAPVPYIEIKHLKLNNKVSTCYIYQYKLFAALLLLGVGVFLIFF